ncbi:hypothetical protein QQ045_010516 [Rhodiola kirilowii]
MEDLKQRGESGVVRGHPPMPQPAMLYCIYQKSRQAAALVDVLGQLFNEQGPAWSQNRARLSPTKDQIHTMFKKCDLRTFSVLLFHDKSNGTLYFRALCMLIRNWAKCCSCTSSSDTAAFGYEFRRYWKRVCQVL